MKPLFFLLLTFSAAASANVYQCEVDGVITYSQLPCSDNATVTTYSTKDTTSQITAQSTAQSSTVAGESATATIERLSESVKKRDMRIAINRLNTDKAAKLAERDDKIAGLKHAKRYSANNLAGAVRNESLSKEMAAVAAQYDTDVRAIDTEISRLTEQLKGL